MTGMKEKKVQEEGVKKEKLTPMMKQYFDMKADHPEALLLFRCGDFYEAYGDDAATVSKVTGIVLTRRSSVTADPMAMAGVPYHAINNYLPKLIRAGYKVAICDQLEDPKLAKGLVKRGITELITPGIAFNEQMLEQKENNFLAGLCYSKDKCGAAFLDVSTGTFQIAEGSLDYIGTLLSSFSPKEIVVERGYEKGTRERFGQNIYISSVEEWAFVYDSAVKRLCRQLAVDSLKGFAISGFPHGICAAGALMVYLEQTQHSGLRNICSISRIDADKFVWMDRFTFRNLEVFASAAGSEGVSLVDVIDRCQSPMGARMLRQWLSMPVKDIDEINDRFDAVGFFKDNPDILSPLQECIGNLGDLERIISRAAAGKILPREVMQLGRGLSQIAPVSSLCAQAGIASMNRMIAELTGCDTLIERIRTTMAAEPAAQVGKGPVIGDGVSAELDELRMISGHGKEYLAELQQRLSESTGIPSLKISYNNVFKYYIEVRNTYRDQVPQEWIRKQTTVNAERYITEELKEYEEKILTAEERIYALEVELYGKLVADIQEAIAAIQKNCRILARIDVLSSFADLATTNRYCRPVVNDGYVLDIRAGRHPVIETLMPAGEEFVPNDLYLDNSGQQIIILTGPNMAGKSALLRQSALIVLLAQIGCFVPADAATIGCCDKIFTRVGATDNISRGESTFMVEMLETSMILHNMSARSLILLDEIGRGTSTYDGMSIARAIVEYIHEYGQGAKTLFATHYHELNDLETIYPRVRNFHIAVKEVDKKVIFLRKLCAGGVERSFGIHVARLAGMPRQVLDSAERTLASLEKGSGPVVKALSEAPKKTVKPHNTKEGHVEADGSLQLSFFQLDDPLLGSLRDDLNAADLNNMTPLQAFDLLRSMKEKLGI